MIKKGTKLKYIGNHPSNKKDITYEINEFKIINGDECFNVIPGSPVSWWSIKRAPYYWQVIKPKVHKNITVL